MAQVQLVEVWIDDHQHLHSAALFVDGNLVQAAKPDMITDSVDVEPLNEAAHNLAAYLKAELAKMEVNLCSPEFNASEAPDYVDGLVGFSAQLDDDYSIQTVNTERIDRYVPKQTFVIEFSTISADGALKEGRTFECEASSAEEALQHLFSVVESGPASETVLTLSFKQGPAPEHVAIRDGELDALRLIPSEDLGDQVYLRVGNVDVKVQQTDEGVVVDLFDRHGTLEPLASTYLHFTEALPEDDLLSENSVSPLPSM
ncbi:hypothetical protein [Marinobacterium sp. BA1]|uniref:hypothetical protein n=1 Tax=Marinobacterium sp. BA1 TaxID=3138931 RepID=UPI0032E62D7D